MGTAADPCGWGFREELLLHISSLDPGIQIQITGQRHQTVECNPISPCDRLEEKAELRAGRPPGPRSGTLFSFIWTCVTANRECNFIFSSTLSLSVSKESHQSRLTKKAGESSSLKAPLIVLNISSFQLASFSRQTGHKPSFSVLGKSNSLS